MGSLRGLGCGGCVAGTPSRALCRPVRASQHSASSTQTAGARSEELRAHELGEQLRQWVEDAGGYVHPTLRVSLATPHGSRGVVAVDSISLQGVQQGPLVAVPERVLLTTQAARQAMGPALERAQARQPWWAAMARRQPQALDPTLLLALFLATERQKGAASAWWPYVAALSDDPPCGWALAPHQLDASLAALGSLAGGWAPRVHAAAAAVQQRCEAAAQSYGDELGVLAGDVRWALGHVVSRCFGSGDDLALLPFIDLCNHHQHAGTPQGHTAAGGQPCAAVFSQHRGVEAAMPAGAELYISYIAGCPPLSMFLNFGFVPDEHRMEG